MMTKSEYLNYIKDKATEYYEGTPSITDEEFDNLVSKFIETYGDNDQLHTPGWGYSPKSTDIKIAHHCGVVGGLPKIHSVSSFKSNYIVRSDKEDGLSCVSTFTDGKLVSAVTRGDGYTGIDITNKVKKIIENSSYDVSGIAGTFVVRGELVVSNKSWNSVHNKYPDVKNSRNFAAGVIRRNEITDDLKYIDYVIYKLMAVDHEFIDFYDIDINNIDSVVKFLFTNFDNKVGFSISIPITDQDMISEFNKGSDYPRDGYVFTASCYSENKANEYGLHVISYDDIAYKFEAESKITEVTGIEWNLTRTHKLIPTVLYNPVELSGATCSRATGFNAYNVISRKIEKGSKIRVMRSNEVIPYIAEVIEEVNCNTPNICPICGNPLVMNGYDLECTNPDCNPVESIIHYVFSVTSVNGLGRKTVESDIFDSNALSIIDYIEYAKSHLNDTNLTITESKLNDMYHQLSSSVSLSYALSGLNIPGISWKTATKIEDYIVDNCTISQLTNAIYNNSLESLLSIEFTSNVCSKVNTACDKLKLIDSEVGLVIHDKVESIDDNYTKGSIIITGTLSVKRSEFYKLALTHGWTAASSVATATYLITNDKDSSSSKCKKAHELGKDILTEDEFKKVW